MTENIRKTYDGREVVTLAEALALVGLTLSHVRNLHNLKPDELVLKPVPSPYAPGANHAITNEGGAFFAWCGNSAELFAFGRVAESTSTITGKTSLYAVNSGITVAITEERGENGARGFFGLDLMIAC